MRAESEWEQNSSQLLTNILNACGSQGWLGWDQIQWLKTQFKSSTQAEGIQECRLSSAWAGNWSWEPRPGIKPTHPSVGCGCPKEQIKRCLMPSRWHGITASLLRVPPSFPFSFLLLHLRRQWVMTQVFGSLPTHGGDSDGILSFWLLPGLALTITDTWGWGVHQ